MNCVASRLILSKRMSREADPVTTCYKKAQNGDGMARNPAKLRHMPPILRQPYVSVASTSHPYHPGVGSDSLNVALGSIRGGLFSWLATGGVPVVCGVPDLAVGWPKTKARWSKTVSDRNPYAPQLPNRRSVCIGMPRGWSGPPTAPTMSFTKDQL